MNKAKNRVSLQAIATAAGVSKGAVAFALRNGRGVSKETRERILQIAKEMGYMPDPRVNAFMATVRNAKNAQPATIAWINSNPEKNAWHKYKFFSPYIEGARSRALELGYELYELWLRVPGITMAKASRMLWQRGIEGIIITPPSLHIRFNWECFSTVVIGTDLHWPHMHRVETDLGYNLMNAFRTVAKLGYRRIGICLQHYFRGERDVKHAIANYLSSQIPRASRIPPLFYMIKPGDVSEGKEMFQKWARRHQPEVIVCHNNMILTWVRELGLAVPDDVGIVHLATDDDVADWAGIHSNRRELGAIAAELLITSINKREVGIPEVARWTMIRGKWHGGWTLIEKESGKKSRSIRG